MSWLYNGAVVDDDTLQEDYKAFVYVITNTTNGKKYIGKKRLHFIRRKKVKDRKNRTKVVKESDWKEYYGSSESLAKDIASLGKQAFTREIIRFCKSTAESSYWELHEQIVNGVLFKPAEFYNNYVGARIHRKHVYKGP